MTTAIEVVPIYGWGWIIADQPRFEVPQPFTMAVETSETDRWTGLVLNEGHEFEGQRVTLSQRTVEWSGYVNIVVGPRGQTHPAAAGYGMLAERPPV